MVGGVSRQGISRSPDRDDRSSGEPRTAVMLTVLCLLHITEAINPICLAVFRLLEWQYNAQLIGLWLVWDSWMEVVSDSSSSVSRGIIAFEWKGP